jgi:hypothetical protein
MGDGLGLRHPRTAAPARWPRRAIDFDQGVWALLVAGLVVTAAGILGLFLGLDGGGTAAALIAGALLTGLAAVLFTLASPRYVGTTSMLARTLFDYSEARARLAALDLPEPLREPLLRLARGEAAQAYLEVVLRDRESAAAGTEGTGTGTGRAGGRPDASATTAVDAERIAADAVERARAALSPAASEVQRPQATQATQGTGGRVVSAYQAPAAGDTLDQPMPR